MGVGTNRLGNNGGRGYSFLFQPVEVDCQFVVDNTTASGISSLKGSGVQNVYMYSSSPSSANPLSDATASKGIALVQLSNNYYKYAAMFGSVVPPLTGSNIAINGSALTAGQPYVITDVGHGTAGAVTIAPVADVAGSLASTYFYLYDSYGNKFIVWFSVSGVGSAPIGVSGILVQQSITTGDSAATIGTALAVTLAAIPAYQPSNPSAPSGVFSFTTAGTTTVTVTNTLNVPFPGGPAEGGIATGFTFAVTKDQTNLQNWQAVGLKKGIVPAVGVPFIATATGYSSRGGSTGQVKVPSVSGVSTVEVIGDSNLVINPIPMGGSPNVGGWVMVQFVQPSIAGAFTGAALATHNHGLKIIGGQAAASTDAVSAKTLTFGKEAATDITIAGANSATLGGVVGISAGTPAGTIANTTTMAPVAPAAGSVIRLSFIFESKSVIVAGV